MSEIPEDIMKAAKVLAGEWSSINTREYEGDFKADLAEDFAAAILAERERCAKVALERKLSDHPRLSPGSEINAWWSGQELAASEIADAIMNGEPNAK